MDRDRARKEIDAFVEAERDRCLWFVSRAFVPRTDEERSWALDQIQRHADRATFVRAAELERCLSQRSNDASAGS